MNSLKKPPTPVKTPVNAINTGKASPQAGLTFRLGLGTGAAGLPISNRKTKSSNGKAKNSDEKAKDSNERAECSSVSRAKVPSGVELLHDPTFNKGTAFTQSDRAAFGLQGLLPPRIISQEEQALRVIENVRAAKSDLDKYNFLIGLQDRNETLFHRVLIDHLAELMPIIYTPTIGLACQEYGHIFRRSRGMYLSDNDRGHIREVLDNWPSDDVRVIVVTDGERILGLGDLGAHGMGIPVGKLSLYTACAGVKPSQCLPVTLDVGTNNSHLLADPLYLGLPHERIRGEAYDSFVDEFITAARDRFPNVLIQLEDFGNANAFRLLERYKNTACLFNDDIQGTASVTLAGIYSALRITREQLADQTIVLFGAGEAATGIGDLITLALVEEGWSESQARKHCWLIDSKGLVVQSRTDLTEHKRVYAHEHEPLCDLPSIVRALHPTILIGASGQHGAFNHEALSAIAGYCDHPIIFALSNPTSQSECTAEEAYTYTSGRAIFASGSPFPDFKTGIRTISSGQANNAYIFPAVGLGIILSGATRVTQEMFFIAAKKLASEVTDEDLASGRVYPSLSRIREVSSKIAAAVATIAFHRGLATVPEPSDILGWIRSEVYDPDYPSYV
jgi:malate dehydrogenase (oxaloacetate-decarboxylating)(NADP+)